MDLSGTPYARGPAVMLIHPDAIDGVPTVTVDGATLPEWLPVEYFGSDDAPNVELKVAYDGTRWGARDVILSGRVTRDHMQTVARLLPAMVEQAVLAWTTGPLGVLFMNRDTMPAHATATRQRQRRHGMTAEHLQQVADVCRQHPDLPPATALQDHWPTSKTTAHRWVKLAREEGLI